MPDAPHVARTNLKLAMAAYWVGHGKPMPVKIGELTTFFAEHAVVRNPRTVERWLSGETVIPEVARRAVARIIEDFTG